MQTNRVNGFYTIDGVKYPSVTTILSAISKPALYHYHFKQSHIISREFEQYSFDEAWREFKGRQQEVMVRGTGVHDIMEAWARKQPFILDKDNGYHRAINNFLAKEGKDILPAYIEQTVVSKKYGYTGTLDLAMFYKDAGYICDYKTGKALYPEVALQLSAYAQALKEMGIVKRPQKLMAILFKEDGTYETRIYKDEFKTFLHVKKVWDYLQAYEK